jgi:hypothetical protein
VETEIKVLGVTYEGENFLVRPCDNRFLKKDPTLWNWLMEALSLQARIHNEGKEAMLLSGGVNAIFTGSLET